MRVKNTRVLAAAILSVAGAPAFAQDNATKPANVNSAEETSPGDIIVTARRRAENLQDVPVAVTALSGQQLQSAGITRAADLQLRTPGLTTTGSNGDRQQTTFAIRGQRSIEYQLLSDPPVGTYFAEVVQPRAYGFGKSFYDLQSVQVLKGVQGTLFGRNVTGGAVLVEPNRPTDKWEGDAAVQVGNYNLRQFQGMLNVPLGDLAALRFAGLVNKRDGWAHDVSNGRDYEDQNYGSFRVSGLITPAAGVSSLTILDWYRAREHGPVSFLEDIDATTPGKVLTTMEKLRRAGLITTNVPAQFAAAQQLFAAHRFSFASSLGQGGSLDAFNTLPYSYVKNVGVSNRTTWDIGNATLKNIVGYRSLKRDRVGPFYSIPAHLLDARTIADIDNVSEELQLQGRALGNRLNYTIGGFYFRESGYDGALVAQFPELTFLGFKLPQTTPASRILLDQTHTRGVANSAAGYAAGSFAVTDQIKLSGGVRYNYDRRKVIEVATRPNLSLCAFDPDGAGPLPVLPFADCSVTNSKSFRAVTWDATLQYDPSADWTGYVSTRRGFRSGGFSLRALNGPALSPFKPETVQEYELGVKNQGRLGDGRYSLNGALFFQDYRNIQRQASFLFNGYPATIIVNRGHQQNYGGELEFNSRFDNGLGIGLFYAYVGVKVITYADGTSNPDGTVALQGIPHHQLGGNISFDHDLPRGLGSISASVNAVYKSRQQLDDRDLPSIEPGYALVNARIDWHDIGGSNFGAAVFATNLTNTFYRLSVAGLLDSVGTLAATYGEPRMFGVEANYKF